MDLKRWNKLYENNKKLDDIFKDKYKNDNKLYEKNEIELLVEIGEFINETKFFKYWTNKKPDKNKILDEYADVITMILTFYHELDIDMKKYYLEIEETDLLVLVSEIYKLAIYFIESDLEEDLEELFKYVLYVGTIKKVDQIERAIIFDNRKTISIKDVVDIKLIHDETSN